MIVLDTNALPVRGELRNPIMSAVLRAAEANAIPVCLPSVVLDESVNMRVVAVAEASQRLKDAVSTAGKLFDVGPVYIPDADEVGELWRAELNEAFSILELDGRDAIEALRRESLRIPPAREGRGGRDVAIWLTALRGPETLQLEPSVYFVSNNTADFADSTNELLPELRQEVSDRGILLTYKQNLDGVLAALSAPFAYTASPADIEYLTENLPELLNEYLSTSEDGDTWFTVTAAQDISAVQTKRALTAGDVWLVMLNFTATLTQVDSIFDMERTGSYRVRAWVELTSDSGPIRTVTIERVSAAN